MFHRPDAAWRVAVAPNAIVLHVAPAPESVVSGSVEA